jgi:hypothetical protein
MAEGWAESAARSVCMALEADMRRLGVVTTAHYERGVPLIAEALRAAAAGERQAVRDHVAALGNRPEDDCPGCVNDVLAFIDGRDRAEGG